VTSLVPAIALAVALAVLGGCSSDDPAPADEIQLGSSSTPADEPPESPSESASDPEGEFDNEGHEIHAGKIPAGDEKSAVAEAWLAYWQTRFDAFAGPELDPAALGQVASGKAAEQVISYVRYLEDKGLYTKGDALIGVSGVKIRGDEATLRSCVQNLSVDVKQKTDRPAEQLQPFYTLSGVLRRVSDQWAVTEVTRLGTSPCRP
jgi:hypothetical protein